MNITTFTNTVSRLSFAAAFVVGLAFGGPAQAKVFQADFNGDGLDDYVIQAPRDNVYGVSGAGSVMIRYGSDGAYKSHEHEAVWTPIHQGPSNMKANPGTNDMFGYAVAIGDFNGDGYDDLAVSTPWESTADGGVVHVLLGRANGTVQPGSRPYLYMGNFGSQHFQNQAYFGKSLAAGDFNQDGYDDLAVGVPSHDVNGIADAGVVLVYWGTSNSLSPSRTQWLYQSQPLIGEQLEAGDYFGSSLAAADFNRDGYEDLAIGTSSEDFGTITRAGLVTVVSGGVQGFMPGQTKAFVDTHTETGGMETNDRFGEVLEPGDFNGDGYMDLAIGSPNEDSRAQGDGAVTILYGESTGLSVEGRQVWHGNISTLPDKGEDSDRMGAALAAGDFNNDGYDDLAMGAPSEDQERRLNFDRLSTGQVTVVSGGENGLISGSEKLWHQDVAGISGSREDGDHFGNNLHVADVNHDNIADLIVTVPGEDRRVVYYRDSRGRTYYKNLEDAGMAHVLYGTHGNGLSTDKALGKQLRYQPYGSNYTDPYKARAEDKFGGYFYDFGF